MSAAIAAAATAGFVVEVGDECGRRNVVELSDRVENDARDVHDAWEQQVVTTANKDSQAAPVEWSDADIPSTLRRHHC